MSGFLHRFRSLFRRRGLAADRGLEMRQQLIQSVNTFRVQFAQLLVNGGLDWACDRLLMVAEIPFHRLEGRGFELPSFFSGNSALHPHRDAKSDAFSTPISIVSDSNDDLQRLLFAWNKLGEIDRRSISELAELLALKRGSAESKFDR